MSTRGSSIVVHAGWIVGTVVALVATVLFVLAGAESASALSPPEQARIVFVNDGRIVSVGADGSDRRVLTRKKAWVGQWWGIRDDSPSVSPDGEKILFDRSYDGFKKGIQTGPMTIGRDGSNLSRVLADAGFGEQFSAVWSADGSRLYVVTYEEISSADDPEAGEITVRLLSVLPDGSDRRQILAHSFEWDDDSVTGDTRVPIAAYPSPAGDRLLVETFDIVEDAPSRLEWVDETTGERTLFEDDASAAGWSPDGKRVVFDSDRDKIDVYCYEGRCSGDSQIFVKDVETGAVTRLIPGKPSGANWSPSWSPDGKRIAFSSSRRPAGSDVGTEIWTIAPDGTCLRRVTNGAPDSLTPDWTPGDSGRTCSGDPGPALSELRLTNGPFAEGLKPSWLGQESRELLLDYSFLEGRHLIASYEDCGSPDGRCGSPVIVRSGPTCSKAMTGRLMTGNYRGIERYRGGLLARTFRSKGLIHSIFFSGGVETEIITPGRHLGKTLGFGLHRSLAGELRPVESGLAKRGRRAPAVFPRTLVLEARKMVAEYRRTGSLRVAAKRAKVMEEPNFWGYSYTRKGALAWLRFGRDLNRMGKVRTVACKRWNNKPGSIEMRSLIREMLE